MTHTIVKVNFDNGREATFKAPRNFRAIGGGVRDNKPFFFARIESNTDLVTHKYIVTKHGESFDGEKMDLVGVLNPCDNSDFFFLFEVHSSIRGL